ncbi:MAG: hypothetical protein IJ253_06650 [Bacteroidaceae bacterium]|nr:hypothetical protein [Bacteroidaceae bacterium]
MARRFNILMQLRLTFTALLPAAGIAALDALERFCPLAGVEEFTPVRKSKIENLHDFILLFAHLFVTLQHETYF